jgi:hypothetical protein
MSMITQPVGLVSEMVHGAEVARWLKYKLIAHNSCKDGETRDAAHAKNRRPG